MTTDMSNKFFIPNIKLVGYGRSQSYQICCLKCGKLEFNMSTVRSHTDLFCDGHYDDKLIMPENESSINFIGNIIGWEVKSATIFKRRSFYNYRKVYERDRYTCQYCGYNLKEATEFRPLHIDHIIPWTASGSNSMNNLVVSCASCNLRASNKWFQNFQEKKRFLLEKKA